MKAKKMIALAALILALCGCGTSAAASEDNVESSAWNGLTVKVV